MNLRFAGFGGQGVVLCGLVFGRAAMLDGKNALQTQAYGSASRGGLTKADVCIQPGEIHDLVCDGLDVLVALSREAYERYHGAIAAAGTLFYESDLVEVDPAPGTRRFGVPATDIAFKQFGRKIIANMVMMGFVNAIAEVVSDASLARVIRDSVPRGTEEKNLAALEEGRRLGAAALAAQG
jgi:2-oxoglutarate ferredoxin oxidoreductase subunit gamma